MKPILVPTKKYTPWKVHFPSGRRFFKTEKDANEAISGFTKGKTSTALGKRAMDEVLYAKSLLGDTPLLTAVRFFLEHHAVVDGKATVGQACDLYWASVATETASPYYTVKVKQHLGNVKKGLGSDLPLTAVSALAYQTFLKGLGKLSQQHAHHRTCRGLFNHAVAHQLMVKNPTHTSAKRRDDWTPPELPKKRPVFLQVEAARLLLDWTWLNCPRLVPSFALQLFCGVRTAELSREKTDHKRPLDWADLNFETKKIDIPAEVSKTGERRVIDWTEDSLWEWLRPYRQASGPVCCADYQHLKYLKIKACTEELQLDGIDLGFDQNAFRHSFATYAVAFWQSAERVALLMGHRGSNMIFQHYREYASEDQAVDFFTIKPAAPLLLQLLHDLQDDNPDLCREAAA